MTGHGLRAEIHDLGYQRYSGPRNPASRRWRVIMRYELAFAWQTWWRYKLSLALSVITTFTFGTIIYVMRSETISRLDITGHMMQLVDVLMFTAMRVYTYVAFVLSMTLTATIIANDARNGVLTFHFVRSTRPIDYVLGRFAGLCVLNGTIFAGPVLLALLRAGLVGTAAGVADRFVLVPELAALCALSTAAFAAVPLAFSALSRKQWAGFAVWAGWYVMGGQVTSVLSMVVAGWFGALDIGQCATQGTMRLLDVQFTLPGSGHGRDNDVHIANVPLSAALISLAVQTVLALALTTLKLQRDQRDAAGGS